MTDQQLAVREATSIVRGNAFDDPTRELIRKTVSDPRSPLSTDELNLFLAVCQHTGLNPLNREIYALKIDGRFTVYTGIDGHRRIAQASRRFRGMAGPFYCGADGKWTDVWLEPTAPRACKVGVYLPGTPEPTWGIAYFKNYQNRKSDGWKNTPEHMLAIRAEAFALRKCFSRELAGLALPDDDDRPAYVDADGVIDERAQLQALEAGPAPRAQAISDALDAEIAAVDAEAALDQDVATVDADAAIEATAQRPPASSPKWSGTPLGRQVSALVDALTEAGKKFSLPDDDAGEAELKGWIASKKTVLGQRD